MPRIGDIVLAVALLAVVALVVGRATETIVDRRTAVARVSDGDSLRMDGERIRLEGIDAPELEQTCTRLNTVYSCGLEARDALVRLIGNRPVTCESNRRDRYQRLLARCVVVAVDINRSMVELGWALSYGDYADAETTARSAKAGVWAGTFDTPREWRRIHDRPAEAEHDVFSQLFDYISGVLRSRSFDKQTNGGQEHETF